MVPTTLPSGTSAALRAAEQTMQQSPGRNHLTN